MHRALVLPFLLLAACTRAPDMAACRLVGTWRPVPSAALVKDIRELGGCSVEDDRPFGTDPVDRYCERRTLTFVATGAWDTPELASDPLAPKRQWRLIDDQAARVTVEMRGMPLTKGPAEITFVFTSPDEMQEQPDGMRYARVDAAVHRPAAAVRVPSDEPIGDFPIGTTPMLKPKK